MDGGWFVRLQWRRRGAWLWPVFVTMTVVDAILGHALPPAGDSQSLAAAAIGALVVNLLGVLLLSRPLGMLLRRGRPDLPSVVARNYAGTSVVLAISLAFAAAGLVHHDTVVSNQNALRDATARAQAWIGARAPDQFRRQVGHLDTFTIQAGSVYRTCVPSVDGTRTYCVIVKTYLPFARSVSFDGYEPNSVFAEGVG
jgi:hypothetical protein